MKFALPARLIVLIGLLFGSCCFADNWPQWRNGDLSSVSREIDVPVEFGPDKNLLWRVPLPGSGGASPIVWEDKVFVTSVDGSDLVLMCIGMDGKELWKHNIAGSDQKSRDGANSASPSPSTDGKHVWAMMGNGQLVCYTVDGDLVWQKDLQKEYGEFNIQFGMSSTPILDNGNLYLALIHGNMRDSKTTSKGQVIALDAASGKQIWMVERITDGVSENKHSYASPTIYRDDQHAFLITHGADFAIGHSLTDGHELWRCGGFNPKSAYNPYLRLVASPACGPGIIVVPTAKRGPVLGLKVDLKGDVTADQDALHWRLDQGTPDVATPLVYEGLVYLAGERGDLTCLDITTGEVNFRERLMADKHRSTPVAAGGNIYIADRKGVVYVIKSGKTLEVVAKNAIDEEITASPAISNGKIFIRTFDALYAFGEKK